MKVSSEAASANTDGAEAFRKELHRIIVDKKYLPEQILEVSKTSLFWKCMLGHTCISQEPKTVPEFKALKGHVMLLVGINVADFK